MKKVIGFIFILIGWLMATTFEHAIKWGVIDAALYSLKSKSIPTRGKEGLGE